MSNYARTTELVGAANNAAGASNEQFSKTLDSLETKTAKLRNAWDTFLMGLSNNQIIKGAVDLLNVILVTINKIIDTLSFGSGFLKSIGSLVVAILGLKIGKKILGSVFGKIAEWKANGFKSGKAAGDGIFGGLKTKQKSVKEAAKKLFKIEQKDLINLDYSAINEEYESIIKASKEFANTQDATYSSLYHNNIKLKEASIAQSYYNQAQQAGIISLSASEKAFIDNTAAEIAKIQADKEAFASTLSKAQIQELDTIIAEKNAAVTETLVHAKVRENAANMSGIKGIAARLSLKIADIIQTRVSTKATWLQKIAQDALNGSMLLGKLAIGGIIAGLVGLGVAIYSIIKASKGMSLDEQLAQIKEQAEECKEGIDAAQDSIDELADKRSSLESLEEEFENLTKGSLEWKKKLLEINTLIMELADKYGFNITIGESGLFQISEEQFNTAEKALIEKIQSGQSYQNYLNLQSKLKTSEQKNIKDFGYDTITSLKAAAEDLKDYIAQLESFANYAPSGEAELSTIEKSKQDYKDLMERLLVYQQEKEIAENEYASQKGSNIVQRVEGLNNEYIDAFSKIISNRINSEADIAAIEERANNITLKGDDLKEKYAKAMSIRVDDIGDITDQAMKEAIAQKEYELEQIEFYKDYLFEIQGELNNLPEEERDKKIRRLSGNITGKDIIEILRSSSGYGAGYYAQSQISERLKGYEFDKDIMKSFTNSALKSLRDNFSIIFEASGKEAQEQLANSIEAIANTMNVEDADKFANALNAIDWTNIDSIKKLPEDLDSLGLVTEDNEGKINKLVVEMIELSKATKSINLESITSEITSLAKILNKITSGKTRQFTEDEYNILIESNIASPEDFIYNVATDTYDYLNQSIDNLIEAIKENTDEITKNTLEREIKSGEAAKGALETGGSTKKIISRYMELAGEASFISQDAFNKADAQQLEDWLVTLKELELNLEENIDSLNSINHLTQILTQSELPFYNAIVGNVEALKAQAIAAGVTTEIIDKYGKASKVADRLALAKITQIYKEATAWEVDTKALEEYAHQLSITNNLSDSVAYGIALSNINLNNGIMGLIDTYEDWNSILERGQIDNSIKSTIQYSKALSIVKDYTKQLLNSNEDLTDGFFENARVLKILDELSKGNIAHLEELRQLAAKDYLMKLSITTDKKDEKAAINSLSTFLASNPLPDLEIGVTLDNDKLIQTFNELIRKAKLTSTEIKQLFYTLGYDVELTDLPINFPGLTEPIHVYAIKTLTSTGENGGNIDVETINAGKANKNNNKWENPYDKFYNLLQKINELSRERNKLEAEYDRLVNNRNVTGVEIIKNSLKRIALIQREIALQKTLQKGRLQELANLQNETFIDSEGNERTFAQLGVGKYARYDKESNQIVINWEAIDKIRDTDKGEAIQAYIDRLEELQSSLEETEDTISEMQDTLEELKQQSKENFLDFEQRIYDALVQDQQNIIDNYQALSDIISDSNQAVIDALQESIDLQRQIRDNTKTEETIADKERRLAYLRRDTSGANAQEILALERELEDSQESYQDTLIDQAINRLSEENDKAAEQREKQIEVMQSMLDYQEETGAFWETVYQLIDGAINDDGTLIADSELVLLLQEIENTASMSIFGQQHWLDQLTQDYAEAQEGLYNWLHDENFVDNISLQNQFSNLIRVWNNSFNDLHDWINDIDINPTTPPGGSNEGGTPSPVNPPVEPSLAGVVSGIVGNLKKGDEGTDVENLQRALNFLRSTGYFNVKGKKPEKLTVDGKFGQKTENRLKLFQGKNHISPINGILNYATKNAFRLLGYKNGGIVDFTGPAWLDGTKTQPEAILNAKDTQNFIELKDTLSGLKQKGISSIQNSGDNYYKIDIHVDEISNDYDVDKLAKRIKEELYNDATYRNVNLINNLR